MKKSLKKWYSELVFQHTKAKISNTINTVIIPMLKVAILLLVIVNLFLCIYSTYIMQAGTINATLFEQLSQLTEWMVSP